MNFGKNTKSKRRPNWGAENARKKQALREQVQGMHSNLCSTPVRGPLSSSSSSSSSSSDSSSDSESNEGIEEGIEDLDSYFEFDASVSVADALKAEFQRHLTKFDENIKWVTSPGAQEALLREKKRIERAYAGGSGSGLGRKLNYYITDFEVVAAYCESHLTHNEVMMSFKRGADEDETAKTWYRYYQTTSQPQYYQKKRRDNLTGGISKFLAFLFVIELDDFSSFIPPFGSIKNVAQDFKLIDSYLDQRYKLGHRAVSIVGDLSKLNFFVKRIAAAFYCIDIEQRTKLIQKYDYILEVINATPALAEYISMRIKSVRAHSVIQHNEKYSMAGMKDLGLWVSREKVKNDRKILVEKILLFETALENKSYPLKAVDDTSKKIQRTFAACQCMIIALICNTCYGNRTQVMRKLKMNERRATCCFHKNCKEHNGEHEQQHVEWDLDKPGREKRQRDRKGLGLVEPDCITKFLDWFITATQDFRLECKDPSFVFFPVLFHFGASQYITLRKSSNFQNVDVNKSIRYTNAVLDVTIPKPSVMRHLYCTHEYLDWHESAPGVDSRSFEKLLEDISYDMNTTAHEVLNTYLVCNYSRYQLHDYEARKRAAAKVNQTLVDFQYT